MNGCFGCDGANPAGLRMRFFRDADGHLGASCIPSQMHRGLGRIVNGGLVTTFAEELAAAAAGQLCEGGLVVAHIEVDYERPAYVGDELRGVVAATSKRERTVDVSVNVNSKGQRVAKLDATFVPISEQRLRELSGSGLEEAPACLVAARGILPVEG